MNLMKVLLRGLLRHLPMTAQIDIQSAETRLSCRRMDGSPALSRGPDRTSHGKQELATSELLRIGL